MMKQQRAILYARTATTHVAASSDAIENQMNTMRGYCMGENIEIAATYDEVVSGNTFQRPVFSSLLKYIRKHKGTIDLLIVAQWDRFSRNFPEAMLMEQKLKDLGIKVVAVAQPVSSLENVLRKP